MIKNITVSAVTAIVVLLTVHAPILIFPIFYLLIGAAFSALVCKYEDEVKLNTIDEWGAICVMTVAWPIVMISVGFSEGLPDYMFSNDYYQLHKPITFGKQSNNN